MVYRATQLLPSRDEGPNQDGEFYILTFKDGLWKYAPLYQMEVLAGLFVYNVNQRPANYVGQVVFVYVSA